MHAGSIAAAFSTSRPAISRHLRMLRAAGLVTVERAGRHWEYRLQWEQLDPLRTWLRGFEPVFSESLLDAFETEVFRTRREVRAAQVTLSDMEEKSA